MEGQPTTLAAIRGAGQVVNAIQRVRRPAEGFEDAPDLDGGEPEGYAVYGYEAAKVVIAAMQRIHAAGRSITREAVLAEVGATKDFAGALGTWSFDANGDTTNRTMSVNTVKDGDFTTVKVVN